MPIWPIAAIKTLQLFKQLQVFEGHIAMLPVLSQTDAMTPHSSVQLDAVFPPTIESLTLWQAQDPASASQCVPRLFVADRDSLPCLRKLTYVGGIMPCDTAQALRKVNIEVVQKDWLRPQAYQFWVDNPPFFVK
ncbi:hypothetical protein LTS10_004767 [Elasticomyces elasticus]|nr:hypothetical protein LTS10_004767 [Elasticomyces elasticus]